MHKTVTIYLIMEQRLTIAEVARLANVPAGTLASWQSRGLVRRGKLTIFDAYSATFARRLIDRGATASVATQVAWDECASWPAVLGYPGRMVLIVSRDAEGELKVNVVPADSLPPPPSDVRTIADLTSIVAAVHSRLPAPRVRAA